MNDILNKLHEVAASPRAQMDGYLAQGKKIVLCAPVYTPEELIHAMGNCSVLYDQEKNRVKWIVDTAKARSAKGVLVVLTKFCDPEEFDYVMIKKACEAADLPLTLVEVDRQMVRFEQVRTNLETFRDLLKM